MSLAIGLLCCESHAKISRGAQTSAPHIVVPQGGVVDSVLPLDEALRRFRAGLPRVDSLSGGAPTRDELVLRFVHAVERSDTTALRAMIITRAEFAYLYYPTSPYVREPTRQPAALAWFFLIEPSRVGVTRVLDRFGGTTVEYREHSCAEPPTREGENIIWQACVLRIGSALEKRALHLFGPVLERDGRFKFLSYANDF